MSDVLARIRLPQPISLRGVRVFHCGGYSVMPREDAQWLPRWRVCAICNQPERPCGLLFGFMVHDHVWEAGGMRPNMVAHLRCFELRLGRDVEPCDLTDAPINDLIRACLAVGVAPWRNV